MRRLIFTLLLLTLLSVSNHAQNRLMLTANGQTRIIRLADTEAAKILGERVKESPISVSLSDYGGFEKVGTLPWNLPVNDGQTTTSPGDVMLYQGNNIVIFYGSNSWAYTPLGCLEEMTVDEIRSFMYGSHIKVTLSASMDTALPTITNNWETLLEVYTLDGNRIDMTGRSIDDLPKGVYIINGEKVSR